MLNETFIYLLSKFQAKNYTVVEAALQALLGLIIKVQGIVQKVVGSLLSVIISWFFGLIALKFFYQSGYSRCDCLKVKDKKYSLLKNFIQKENTSTRDQLTYGK
ncbi:unnamed protein product [Paramecium primaurelia]|uniref:Uncharacterized protein n=1 Tax=Paramecium primaurelia TaxID=5886 RepID=A0A8S1KLT3_PARPR|nr:unnamed protein product [Paramecium primaurelia]